MPSINKTNGSSRRTVQRVFTGWTLAGVFVLDVSPAISARKDKYETIEASAMGTGTQMGQIVGASVEIYEFSTPEDRQVLLNAFAKGHITIELTQNAWKWRMCSIGKARRE
jgi:hypothetical protein